MATKPTNLAEWATGAAPITEPLLAEKQAGWAVASKPPAQWFNWWMKLIHQWILWVNDLQITAHTWTAFQTFNSGLRGYGNNLNPGVRGDSGGSGFAGVYGLSAFTGANEHGVHGVHTGNGGTGVRGSATVGSQAKGVHGSSTSGTGVYGQATAAGGKGVWADGAGGAIGLIATGSHADSLAAYVSGGFGTPTSVAQPALYVQGGGAASTYAGRDGIQTYGGGNDDPANNQGAPAGHGLSAVGGMSAGDDSIAPAISNVAAGHGVKAVGGAIYAQYNEGPCGAGVHATGGSQADPGTGAVQGGTGVVAIAGTGDNGPGYSVDATGDMRLNGNLSMVGADKAVTDPQTNLLSPGLIVKAWARIRIASGSYQLLAGQNIASLVAGTTPTSGQFKLNLASPVPRASRIVIGKSDLPDKDLSPYDYTAALGANDNTLTFEAINRPTDGSAVTTVNLNTNTFIAHIIVLGLQ
ncbi:MAG: hypothetical protein WAZ94_15305 [Phycisphaerales bacterium]|nr:hypothetical protein [Chloroflexota bacterium]